MLLASIHSKIITLTVENYKKLMFLTAEAVLVIAFTNPLTPPPPPISNSVQNFSESVSLLLGHFCYRSIIWLYKRSKKGIKKV